MDYQEKKISQQDLAKIIIYLLSNVFMGTIINDNEKGRDGSPLEFIKPIFEEDEEAIRQWKKEKGFKNGRDGNLPFTPGKFGNKKVPLNILVEFKVRNNSRGLPEAYEVRPLEAKAELTPEFKPIEAKPTVAPTVPTIPSNLVDAVSAAYAEMDEDDFVSIDEMEDEDYSLYDDYDPNDDGGPSVRRFNRADER